MDTIEIQKTKQNMVDIGRHTEYKAKYDGYK